MSDPSILPAFHRIVLACVLLVLGYACGGDRAILDARTAAGRGQLLEAIAILESSSDPAAPALLETLREAQLRRDRLEDRIEVLLERLDGGDERAAQELDLLAEEASDTWEQDLVDRAVSKAVDLAAELRRRKPLQKRVPPKAQLKDPEPAPPEDEIAHAALESVRLRMEEREWASAGKELALIMAGVREPIPTFEAARRDLDAAIETDVALVLDRVRREQSLRGRKAACEYLLSVRGRFPEVGHGARIHKYMASECVEHAQATSLDQPRDDAPDPVGLASQGASHERAGRMLVAAEYWGRAALHATGPEQQRYLMHAVETGERAAVRAAIVAAEGADGPSGLEKADGAGAASGEKAQSWADLESAQLLVLAQAAGIESGLGLAFELLALTDGSGQETGELLLHEAHMAEQLGDRELFEFLTYRAGKLKVPADGYAWDGDSYRTRASLIEEETAARLVELCKQIESGEPEQRDAAFATSIIQGSPTSAIRQALREALRNRLFTQEQVLEQSGLLSQLTDLVVLRDQLDELRRTALELIEDGERYFYPYSEDLVGVQRFRKYTEVQTEIDGLVQRARDLWDSAEPMVHLPGDFREVLRDRAWCVEALEFKGMSVSSYEGTPFWIEGIDFERSVVGLRDFAWSAAEMREHRLWRAIEQRNQVLVLRIGDALQLSRAERDLVQHANAYRMLLGRRPLGWNSKLHNAAAKHSAYMQRTGHFGHAERSQFPTVAARMSSEGYVKLGSENCYLGSTSAANVHRSLIRSSSHHRNLLDKDLHEIGCVRRGAYWTQVFGADSSWVHGL